ncbi:hypothetical protein BGY98DRAFT_1101358 [Russula aff. rugulosa BPL654]|nr:hypothetical protein BGY98DRAFT_1101358 [Russula aff. rugulosa BPL654]
MPSPSAIKTDKYALVKYMKNIGRAYQKQAKELVSISRLFVQAQNHAFDSDTNRSLEILLQAVDDALKSAAEAKKRASNGADKAFKNAVKILTAYDSKKVARVAERMEKAEKEDKSSLKILNRLRETFLPLEEEPTTVVEFLLHESLPDENHNEATTVKQVLSKNSDLQEVLWNFSRYKPADKRRLTLKQNPHFYEDLPRKYKDDFRCDPIEIRNLLGKLEWHSLDKDSPGPKITVLTHRQGRIYIKSGQESRAFGNVWCPKGSPKAIIFKDVCGKLEGEKTVGSAIKDNPHLRCCENLPLKSAKTMVWESLQDWTEPIRRLLESQPPDRDVGDIYLSTEDQSSPHKSSKQTGPDDTTPLPESSQRQPVGNSSKNGTAQSPPSSPSEQTTPASAPSAKPIPSSQHCQTPPNVVQGQQPQDCAFTDPVDSKPEVPTSKARKQDATPVRPTPPEIQAQRGMSRWQSFKKKIWTG